MKAQIYTEYGPPEVVHLVEVEKPIPGKSEVLIQVKTSTVNRSDSGYRSAVYFISRFFTGLFRPKIQILGCEFAGIVTATGEGVSKFTIGDRVFGFTDSRFGGHGEYMLMGENEGIAQMPKSISFETAAAMSEGAHYALEDIRAAKVKEGDNVLIIGGTGAIGSAAVQLLKVLGAKVTAVCPGEYFDTVKALGADEVIDYQTEDFTKTPEKFDFIFDAVGKSRFKFCKPLLKEKGIYISTELGPRAENIWLALSTSISKGKKLLFPIPETRQADITYFAELFEQGRYAPLIDRTYDLEDIVEAYHYVETGQKIGNVLLRINSDE